MFHLYDFSWWNFYYFGWFGSRFEPLLNQNQTIIGPNWWSSPWFCSLGELNLWSGSRFSEFARELDRTGPVHHYHLLIGGVQVVFWQSRWQMQWVNACYSPLINDITLQEWVCFFTNFLGCWWLPHYRCEFVWSVWGWSLIRLSGFIMYIAWNWTGFVVFAMLWGELDTCETSVILTRLKCAASHHHHSVTCHVSRIQKDPDFSYCYLPDSQYFQWSAWYNVNDTFFRGYA
jgi:hypothetical protein